MAETGAVWRRRARRPLFAPVALAGAWVALGALAGLAAALVHPEDRAQAFLSPLLAGVLWIPLSAAAVALARRAAWPGRLAPAWVAVHLVAAVVASFVLNLTFFATLAIAGSVPWTSVGGAAVRAGVGWLHLNALGFLGSVAATHLLDRWGASHGDPGPGSASLDEALTTASGKGGVRIPLRDIDWIAADGDYARVHAGGREYLLSERLKTLADRLEGHCFVRVHRSAIVNVDRVREVRHRSHGDYDAVLADGTTVRVSRARRGALLRHFSGAEQDGDAAP